MIFLDTKDPEFVTIRIPLQGIIKEVSGLRE